MWMRPSLHSATFFTLFWWQNCLSKVQTRSFLHSLILFLHLRQFSFFMSEGPSLSLSWCETRPQSRIFHARASNWMMKSRHRRGLPLPPLLRLQCTWSPITNDQWRSPDMLKAYLVMRMSENTFLFKVSSSSQAVLFFFPLRDDVSKNRSVSSLAAAVAEQFAETLQGCQMRYFEI